VPELGLRRRDRELVGVLAEDVLDRLGLRRVAERRRRPVRVDVVDVLGRIISITPTESGSGAAMW
jgi:hypothetical protein